jgi:hypothetical protein
MTTKNRQNKASNIENEIMHKWGIGNDPVFGSGSLKDIQRLCNECDRLRKENESILCEVKSLTRRAAAKDGIIGELIVANQKIIASAPLTDAQREQLANYVAEYLDRGVHGVWYDLATGIAALMAENERLSKSSNL